MTDFRFSGHESFPWRYSWLPKAFRAIRSNEVVFADEELAMVTLGVGKNMVRSIRFWMQVCGVAQGTSKGYEVTNFGKTLLDPEGLDPYLEDRRTLWLLHWKMSTIVEQPLFAWDFLLNRWPHSEFSRAEVLRTFLLETRRLERKLSPVTLEQHFDVFLRTYYPTNSRKSETQEENLDCPLVELAFVRRIGEREIDSGSRREPIFAFLRGDREGITPELFVYCLHDFWIKRRLGEKTLTFADVALGHGSPGQVFKLSDWDVRQRLESLREDSSSTYEYQESAMLQRVVQTDEVGPSDITLLKAIYARVDTNA